MRRSLLGTLLLSLLSLYTSAQTSLRVQVESSKSREAVIGAVISYGSSATELNQHTVTDVKGVGILHPTTAWCYYEVRAVGMQTLRGRLASSQHEVTLLMSEEVQSLSEVVVTSSHIPVPIKRSPVVTQVISGRKLLESGYGTFQQALMQETPGMNIQKVGFGNEISMQGLDARHILFLVDGDHLTGDMAGNLDYERFNLHGIDRVEIVKGASSTLYGSRAAGAVINLITKKTYKPLDVTAGVRYGQQNERNYRHPVPKDFLYMYEKNSDRPNLQAWLSAGMKRGIWTTQTDIWYSSADAYYMYQKSKDIKRYTAEANPFLPHDTTVVSSANRPPLGISGSEHISLAQKVYIEPHTDLRVELYGTAFFMNTYDLIQDLYFTQSKDYTGGIRLRYQWQDYLSLTAILHTDFYERYKRHERRDERQLVYDSRIWQPRLRLRSTYFDRHEILGGVEYLRDDLTSDRFVNQKMTTRGLREWEWYLQDNFTMTPQWTIEGGVRTTFSRPFGLMALPKVAVKYSPSESLSLRLNYAMGFRSPSIKELFFNWDHLGMFKIVGDERLQPEKNQYCSLGIEYNHRGFFLSANAYANYFYKKIEGVWRIYELQYNFEYMNLKNQRLLGIDALMKWEIIDQTLTLNGSYSYVNVQDTHGVRINTTSPHAATASLTFRWAKGNNYQLNATLSAAFTGSKRFDVQDRLTMPMPTKMNDGSIKIRPSSREAYFRCELPAYTLCNLNVTQTLWQHYRLSLGIENLLNYTPQTLGSGVTLFNIPATPGARAFVQLEYHF